jgi:hypothetical protein
MFVCSGPGDPPKTLGSFMDTTATTAHHNVSILLNSDQPECDEENPAISSTVSKQFCKQLTIQVVDPEHYNG